MINPFTRFTRPEGANLDSDGAALPMLTCSVFEGRFFLALLCGFLRGLESFEKSTSKKLTRKERRKLVAIAMGDHRARDATCI